MKLYDKEVELVRKLRGLRSRRQKESLLGLAFVVVLFLVDKEFGFLPEDSDILLGIGFGWSIGTVLAAFSNVRPDDKLHALLMRYIDSDAEAIKRIAQPDSKERAEFLDTNYSR